MSAASFTPGPWEFLEEGRSEEEFNAGRHLTVSGGPGHDDIAQIFSRDDAGVSISREEACANARLIAATPLLLAALEEIYAAHLGDCPAATDEADFARGHNYRVRRIARDALVKAGLLS